MLIRRLYLGVDGGQSSTVSLIADETGSVLGAGKGGPCNHVGAEGGRTKFSNAITASVGQACAAAGMHYPDVLFAAACLGFSGGPEDKEAYSRELIHSGQYKITHDADIALSGATAGEPGIIIIAGTGSMAFGRNENGETARAGGWGYIFGDEGGGFDLTRRAFRAALRYEEGWGPATALKNVLLAATESPDALALLHRFYSEFSRSAIASLAPLVTQAAEDGDGIAREILTEAAADLAKFVEAVHSRLFRPKQSVPVACIGGVFRSAPLRADFAYRIQDSIACDVRTPCFGPAAGALLEALRLDGNRSELSGVPESEK